MSTLGKTRHRQPPLLQRQDGFSLLEALVATGILAIISLGSALGTDRALHYNMYSGSLAAATTLVQDKIEELQSKVATDVQLTAGAHDDANSLKADGTAGGIYTRTWTVTNDAPASGLKTVAVSVTYSLLGVSHVVRLVMVHS